MSKRRTDAANQHPRKRRSPRGEPCIDSQHASDREDLGAYPSLEAFARDVVTPLLRPEGLWLLACLDLTRVLATLAGDDRLHLERGRVVLDRRAR